MLQRNARLIAVHAAGDGESYDGPAAAGAEKWTGQADAYVMEKRRWQQGAEGSDVLLDRLLLVDVGAPDVEYTVGDVVTFERLGVPGEETATVAIVQRPMIDDPEIPADLITVRLSLRAA